MSTYYVGSIPITDELYHHGIQGQKWGIRRYQNEDGTLTDAGMKRYYGHPRKIQKDLNKLEKEYAYAKGDEYRNQATYDRINKKTLDKYRKLTGKGDLFDGSADDIQKRFEESGLRDSKNWKKTVEKQNQAMKGMDDAVKRQKEIEAETWKLISKAAQQNYQTIGTPATRNTVRAGEQWVAGMGWLGGAVGGAITGGLQSAINMRKYGGPEHLYTQTNKWKVRG